MRAARFILAPVLLGAILLGAELHDGGAHAQTCDIGGYVGAFPLGPSIQGWFTLTKVGGGGTYQPINGGWGKLYSDGTTLITCQRISGTGPALAECRIHLTDLDTLLVQ